MLLKKSKETRQVEDQRSDRPKNPSTSAEQYLEVNREKVQQRQRSWEMCLTLQLIHLLFTILQGLKTNGNRSYGVMIWSMLKNKIVHNKYWLSRLLELCKLCFSTIYHVSFCVCMFNKSLHIFAILLAKDNEMGVGSVLLPSTVNHCWKNQNSCYCTPVCTKEVTWSELISQGVWISINASNVIRCKDAIWVFFLLAVLTCHSRKDMSGKMMAACVKKREV